MLSLLTTLVCLFYFISIKHNKKDEFDYPSADKQTVHNSTQPNDL